LHKKIIWDALPHRGWRRLNMPMAYVLINTEPKHMDDVVATLEKLDAVVEVFPVYGVYDVVAKIKAESMEKLKEIVTWNVRNLDEVRSTITMLILEEKE
jgi:DNA-binding Lrp family transcriptional regulator